MKIFIQIFKKWGIRMVWIKIKEVAVLMGVTERAIQISIKKAKYEYRHVIGRGRGGQYEIALSSLPQAAQDRYNTADPAPITSYAEIMQYTGKQRAAADFKAQVVSEYHQMGLSVDAFIANFNERNPNDTITKPQLFRWQNKYQQNKDVADLIDNRGGYNRGKSSIQTEAWEYFYNRYMTQHKRTIKLCWDLTKDEYPDIPSVATFERKVKTIPEYAIICYREGPKAFKDKLPSMIRDKTTISSNDIWNSDHRLADVLVIGKSGKLIRPWLTMFYDLRSNKPMGVIAREEPPNATVIKECFRISAEKYGIPKEGYFDNGKDYKSKSFSVDYPMSLVNQLGMNIIYATPYHGQAKPIERFFGTMSHRFDKRFGAILRISSSDIFIHSGLFFASFPK
jgi:hypothetical protein